MGTLSAVVLVASALSAPAPDKPTRWEYAELSYRNVPARPERENPDGKKIEATPAHVEIRWTTGAEEVSFKGWGELAAKLKVELTKDASPTFQRLQALNAIGAGGWELVDSQAGSAVTSRTTAAGGRGAFAAQGGPVTTTVPTGSTMLFKRRLP